MTFKFPNLILAVFAAGIVGCATTKSNVDLLREAGFKKVPASTLQQQTHLATLPSETISKVQRDGVDYFVYPDPDRKLLYVGHDTEYENYRMLRIQQKIKEDKSLLPPSTVGGQDWHGIWGGADSW